MIHKTRAFFHAFGLAGVSPDEHPTALKLNNLFKLLVALAIVVMPILWYLDSKQIKLVEDWVIFGSWLIWLVLVAEISLILLFVRNRIHYIKTNWLNIPILILTFPMILSIIPYAVVLRVLQFMLIARYLSELHKILQRIFKVSQIGAIAIAFVIIVILGGIIMHSIDPNVKTVEDGLWWAVVTMATVGYGDVVPHTTEGRIFGAVIIILGAVFFSLLTAQLAAYMVGEEELMRERDILNLVRQNQRKLSELTEREDKRIEEMLDKMNDRMLHLETMIQLMQAAQVQHLHKLEHNTKEEHESP
jgi:voltage-gated potassium channel